MLFCVCVCFFLPAKEWRWGARYLSKHETIHSCVHPSIHPFSQWVMLFTELDPYCPMKRRQWNRGVSEGESFHTRIDIVSMVILLLYKQHLPGRIRWNELFYFTSPTLSLTLLSLSVAFLVLLFVFRLSPLSFCTHSVFATSISIRSYCENWILNSDGILASEWYSSGQWKCICQGCLKFSWSAWADVEERVYECTHTHTHKSNSSSLAAAFVILFISSLLDLHLTLSTHVM